MEDRDLAGVPLPIKLRRLTNGEYVAPPLSPVVQETIRRTLDISEREARRRGVDRRSFLRSLMGSATMLALLDACSKEELASKTSSSGTTAAVPGGTYSVPTTATTDPDAARDLLSGDEFIFDVQTHLLEFDLDRPDSGSAAAFAQGFPQANCDDPDWRACFNIEHWTREVFGRSDTAMAVISAVPILATPNPLSIAVMEEARRAAEQVCGDGRVFLHGQVNPNVGDIAAMQDGMRRMASDHRLAAWKVYTHVPGNLGWWLDDHDPDAVLCGTPFLDTVREIGPRIVCVHKGFSSGSEYAAPIDIGPVAKANPDISFVVYHSGYEAGAVEGPFDEATADVGVNRLVKSLRDAGVEAGSNVYAELGSTWFNVLRDPNSAAHVLGKLLSAVGEDRVVWGTDSIWYGSPQDQIQALRAFQITPQFQERFGYPKLTDAIKRKIFGANSAELYSLDPAAVCATR